MAEWRLLRGWTPGELAARLHAARALAASAPLWAELSVAAGWNHLISRAVIARERPGVPEAGGAFEHARTLVRRLAFSDRRIVVGHYQPGAPLEGRVVLLELRALREVRFLCPVRVAAVRDESNAAESVFGFQYETLAGHIERGREWFSLTKDHATGEVGFSIEAFWLPGELPGAWARAGFALLGPRYQRAWHRLAHEHLRAALEAWDPMDRAARGRAPQHGRVAALPISVVAQRGRRPARVRVEVEQEANR